MTTAGALASPDLQWQCGRDYEVVRCEDGSDLLFLTANHRVLRVNRDLGERLRQGLSFLSADEVQELQRLVESGIVSNANRERLADASPLDGANLAINVNLTAACNLSCSYCFADGGDYGRFRGKMPSTTVKSIFDFILRHVTASQTVRFEFFGGEPLLNFERIREICQHSDDVARSTGIRFIYRISSNLTVLPHGAVELFARRRFIVSTSIDGGRETHDHNRPGKDGRGSWDRIIEHCHQVREGSDDITLVARMTVTGGRPTLRENVDLLYALNIFDYFQIYPAFSMQPATALVSIGSTRAGAAPASSHGLSEGVLLQFAEFLDVYPRLFSPRNRFRGVLEYERLADMILDGKFALAFCSAGRNYFTFSPDESISSCHRLAGDTAFQVGEGSSDIQADLEPWRRHVDNNPVCSQCWIRYLCGGGCKQENYLSTGSIHTPNRDLCEYQMTLVRGVLRVIASQTTDYLRSDRSSLDNLFVSCGRPVMRSNRADLLMEAPFRYFEPI